MDHFFWWPWWMRLRTWWGEPIEHEGATEEWADMLHKMNKDLEKGRAEREDS